MKAKKIESAKPAVHIIQKELLQPYNPVTVNLIGAGGTGGQVLTALARMNHALVALDHPGLIVRRQGRYCQSWQAIIYNGRNRAI
jgi:hypothetical protein